MTMKALILLCFLVFISSVVLGSGSSVVTGQDLTTYGTIRFNNQNWHILPHPKVSTFSLHDDGSMSGLTEDGRIFFQYAVPNPYGIRVHRFEIEDHYHYIVDGEIADTFTEFSALLAQAYERTIVTG
jgi:hypothetical protein